MSSRPRSRAEACIPILHNALVQGGAIPGRLVGDVLMVDDRSGMVSGVCPIALTPPPPLMFSPDVGAGVKLTSIFLA